MKTAAFALAFGALVRCGPPAAVAIEDVVRDMPRYVERDVVIKMRLRSGARCGQPNEDGVWRTYCKDCVYCRGPYVADVGTSTNADGSDRPLILGGTWELKDIRCKGLLNQIECYPFELGKPYVIQGLLENQHPPRLMVRKFWTAE